MTGLSANDISTLKETVAQAAVKCPVVTGRTVYYEHFSLICCGNIVPL